MSRCSFPCVSLPSMLQALVEHLTAKLDDELAKLTTKRLAVTQRVYEATEEQVVLDLEDTKKEMKVSNQVVSAIFQ